VREGSAVGGARAGMAGMGGPGDILGCGRPSRRPTSAARRHRAGVTPHGRLAGPARPPLRVVGGRRGGRTCVRLGRRHTEPEHAALDQSIVA